MSAIPEARVGSAMTDRGLRARHEGNAEGRSLFFLHGWPDDDRIWDPQVAAFRDRYHCVRLTLPGYGDEDDAPRGMDFPEIAERIVATIDAVCEERGEERIFWIGHDWGAYLSYFVERRAPHRIERMITLDVGGNLEIRSPKTAALIMTYQLPLVASWVARGVAPELADGLARSVARMVRAPLDNRAGPLTARTSYPYFYLWRALTVPAYRDRLLRRYAPRCPLMYMYAERKPAMFHSQRWIDMLEAREDCEVVALDCDHWMTLALPDEVNAAIERFLEGRP